MFLCILTSSFGVDTFFFFCVFARTSQRAGQTTSPNTSCKALKLTYKKGTRTLPSEVALPARKTNSEESASACQNRPTTPEGRKAKPSSTQEQQRSGRRRNPGPRSHGSPYAKSEKATQTPCCTQWQQNPPQPTPIWPRSRQAAKPQ